MSKVRIIVHHMQCSTTEQEITPFIQYNEFCIRQPIQAKMYDNITSQDNAYHTIKKLNSQRSRDTNSPLERYSWLQRSERSQSCVFRHSAVQKLESENAKQYK